MPWYVLLLITLALLIVPFMLGGYVARMWRMPDYGWKFGLILFTAVTGLTIVLHGWPPKLGIDLSGGVNLRYEVDTSKRQNPNEPLTRQQMDQLIAAINTRINPSGVKEVTIRPYGADQIEIIIPEVDEQEAKRIEDLISRAGTLEFRILANNRDDRALIDQALRENTPMVRDAEGKLLGWWVPMYLKENPTPGDIQRIQSLLSYPEITKRQIKQGGHDIWEVLVRNDEDNVTGGFLTQAATGVDRSGQPCVKFSFNQEGATLFGDLTSHNLPDPVQNFTRKLGIILDGQLYSAPSIQSTITAEGEITGSFTQSEVEDLVNVLNAGSLPTALAKAPISRLISGPTLGADTIHKSSVAMIISSILVPLFMVWYYRFSGGVAVVALALNMLLLVAVMILVGARFTLPGLAGLALTIGMAVDNNVLIYERLREELDRGATLRMAIRNAFHRAGTVIVDTNSTHMIAATVLYTVGTDQVKGFAVTFLLGAAISLFTAVFVARVIFEVAERRRWLTQAKMLRLIGHTNIDFMSWFPLCGTLSVLVTVLGLLVAFERGKGLFDIDFTGGVAVEALFKQPKDITLIREKLGDLPDLAVQDVHIQGEEPGKRFIVNTSESDLNAVQQKLQQDFKDELVSNSVTISNLAIIGADSPAETKPAAEGATTPPVEKEKLSTPSSKEQGRRDLPPENMLAMTTPMPWLLAQADAAAAKPAAADAASEKVEKAAAEKPSAAITDAAEKASAKAPAEKPPAAEAKTEKTPAEKAPAEKPAAAAKSPPEATPAATVPFAGGTQARLTFAKDLPVNYETVEAAVRAALQAAGLSPDLTPFQLSNDQYFEGDAKAYPWWDLKIQLPENKAKQVIEALQHSFASKPFFPASSAIGGAVAAGTRIQAVYALVASWMLIILFLWVRFQKVAFGLAAVIALIHDVLVMLGAIAFSYYLVEFVPPLARLLAIDQFKINLPIVAAFLTIIGYSVNDTIVVFDRIREVRGKDPNLTRQMVNDSTNQTLSRTLLTSFTVMLVVAILYLFGGEALHGFAFALLVGVTTGTYSSIYVAAPILLWLIHPPKMRLLSAGRGQAAGQRQPT